MLISEIQLRPNPSGKATLVALAALIFVCQMISAANPVPAHADGLKLSIGVGVLQTLLSGGVKTQTSRQTKRVVTPRNLQASKSSSVIARPAPVAVARAKAPVAVARAVATVPSIATTSKAAKARPDLIKPAEALPTAIVQSETSTPAAVSLTGATLISTAAEITAAQQHLKYLGYDVPTETGTLDLKTKIAVMQFQESVKAPTTGDLTVEQLQALFKAAASRQAKVN